MRRSDVLPVACLILFCMVSTYLVMVQIGAQQ
jgi:hypothetical protein